MASDRSLGAMCGYLAVRRRSARATTHRVFAVISGTTLFEFDSFEDAAIGVRAREHACVIGVCAWDGCSRPRCGFVYVTRGGGPVFATAKSEDEQQQWASAIQRALEHALEGDGDPDVPPSSSDSRCLTTLTDGLEIKSSALQDGPAAFEQLLSLLQFTRGVMTEWLLRSGGPAPMPGPPSSSAPSPPPPPDGPVCEDAAAAPEDLAAVRASLSADADVIVVVRLLYDLALDGTPQSFQLVVEELATRGLDAMDFVWFQVVHIFYFLSAERFSTRVLKTELLKRLIVNVCATSAHLSLKLAWALFAYLEDIQRLDVAAEHRLAREIPVIALLAELQLCVLAEAGADTAPVCRELARVRDCRELVRTSLARPTDKTERTAAAHRADVPPAAADDVRMCSHEQRQAVREQLRFVAHLGQIAERMRFTEPRQRRDALVTELSELGCLMSPPEPKSIGCRTGFDPFGRAEQTLEPIVNIPVNEGHVFHTKARAPTMIVCEVLRTSSVDGSSDETPSESCSALCDDDDGVKELIAKHCATGLQDYLFSAAFAQTAVDSAAQRALEAETRTDPRLVRSHSDNRLTSTGAGKLTRGSKVNAPAPGLRGDIPELKEDIASKDETMAAVVNSHRRETMSPAVSSAVELHEKGVISAAEFAECIRKDALFQDAVDEHQHFDVEFCISHAFGESWASKRSRIRHESPVPAAAVEPSTSQNASARWDLVSMIVKSNDDVRQEVCVLQLIQLCGTIFCGAGLELWLRPYSIISTSASTGLIEVLTDAASLDALKKRNGQYRTLAQHFSHVYGVETEQAHAAKRAFASSLAAYSVVCYMLQIKDRHNGNILLDKDGHLIMIDFGWILGIAPGGAVSVEASVPFKLTTEMVEVMGGVHSGLFAEFVQLFVSGFLALQLHSEKIVHLIEIMAEHSGFPCFHGRDKAEILSRLRSRFRMDLDRDGSVGAALELIRLSYNSPGMRSYDVFQWLTNGILP